MINLDQIPSPCFVLEESKILRNLEILQEVKEKAGVEIILAFKGFAMWSAFPLVREYLSGATASSLYEAKLCELEFGKKAHTYCVAYSEKDFDEIASRSSFLTFNSLNQYNCFQSRIPTGLQIGLRVNPEWSDVETDLYNPAASSSRLGMTRSMLPEELPEAINGLHFHVLCESSAQALENVLIEFEKRFSTYLSRIDWINIGGGHLITRADYDVGHLINQMKRLKDKYGVDIILEPGAAVAWQTGFLRSKVLDVVTNGGVSTAICDISVTCHMPDCLEMPYRPRITSASMDPEHKPFKYRIGGTSCLAGDYLETYGFDYELRPGDDILFEDMMHYTMVKTTMFNGINHPSIGVWKDSKFELIKEFDYQDYRNRLS